MLNDKELYELAEAYLAKGEAIFDKELFSQEVSDKIVQLANEMKQHEAEAATDVAQEEIAEGRYISDAEYANTEVAEASA